MNLLFLCSRVLRWCVRLRELSCWLFPSAINGCCCGLVALKRADAHAVFTCCPRLGHRVPTPWALSGHSPFASKSPAVKPFDSMLSYGCGGIFLSLPCLYTEKPGFCYALK